MSIKKRILSALKKSKKTQQSLADVLGVGKGAVSDMLKKEGTPPLKYIEATARLTGCTKEWLLNGGEEEADISVKEDSVPYVATNINMLIETNGRLSQLITEQHERIKQLEQEIAKLKDLTHE